MFLFFVIYRFFFFFLVLSVCLPLVCLSFFCIGGLFHLSCVWFFGRDRIIFPGVGKSRMWARLVGKAKVSVWRKFMPFNFFPVQERSRGELTLEPSQLIRIPLGLARKGTAFCIQPH